MTREELIAALESMIRLIETAREDARRERQFYRDAMNR